MSATLLLALWLSAAPARDAGAPPRASDGGTVSPLQASVLLHPIVVTAKRAHLDGKKHQISWIGDVKAKREGVDLSCDRLTAVYAGTQENITRMQCDGNVVVVEKDRKGYGDHADFDNVNGVLVFTGNPRATQGNNQFEGDKVTFYVGNDQVEVENARGLIDSAGPKPGGKKKRAPKP